MANAKRKCTFCADFQRREDMIITSKGAWCNHDCQHGTAMKNLNKMKVNKERAERKAKREATQENKQKLRALNEDKYNYQLNLTKREAQKLANRLDKDLPCICCSVPRGKAQFCGGHCKTAGAHPELAISLLNIHGQRNRYCNQQKSGNISGDKHSHGFKEGLRMRYGQWILDYLDNYQPPAKRTCPELIAIRKEMAAEIKRLDKGLPPSRNWRQLP